MRIKFKNYLIAAVVFSSLFLAGCAFVSALRAPQSSVQAELPAYKTHEPVKRPEIPKPPLIRPAPAAKAEPFSIIWIADTQSMVYKGYCDALKAMGDWIVEEKETRNIRYVVHTGDAVDDGFNDKQWENFDVLYHQFRDELPYLPVAGNHDLGVKRQEYDAYLARPYIRDFPAERSFGGGKAVYDTFSAGGTDFLLIGVGWNAEPDAARWIHSVLRAHPNHVAILLVHSFIAIDGTFTEHGEEIYNDIILPNPTIRLVLSGHVRGSGIRIDDLDDDGDGRPDRRVYSMIYNFQHYDLNCGQLRILTFDPETRSIRVETYSPFTHVDYRDEHFRKYEFTLENAF